MSRRRPPSRLRRADTTAFMPLFTGRWLKKTRRLKGRHHGALFLICMALWDEGGALPYDLEELRDIARWDRRTWPAIWKTIEPFFTIQGGVIRQATVDELLAYWTSYREERSESGKRGGAKSAENRRKIKAPGEAELQPSNSKGNQTKGLGSPSYEGENPNRSVTDDDRLALERVVDMAFRQRGLSREAFAMLREPGILEAADGPVLTLSEPPPDRDLEILRREARSHGLTIRIAAQMTLRLVGGLEAPG
jgi:uncharacterized protein YdaU (DUF1376 family)